MTINGDNLQGNVLTEVVFDGQLVVEASNVSATSIIAFVPTEVLNTVGTHSVMVRATDDTGVREIGPAFLSILDRPADGPPVLLLPEAVFAEAESTRGSFVGFDVFAMNPDGSPLTVTCNHTSGDLFPVGPTVVTCSATNNFGTGTGSFPVIVGDTAAPVLTLPASITTDSREVAWTATAVDALDGDLPVVCSPSSGSTFAFGLTRVSCSATDAHANSANGSFTVFVTGGPPTPPSLTVPNDITLPASSAAGRIVLFTATSDPGAEIVCTPGSGSEFPVGLTTVSCTATNPTGQFTTDSFTILITEFAGDITPPILVLPADIFAEATSGSGAMVSYVVTATDDTDGSVTPSCNPPSGSTFVLGTTQVQCSATDSSGNVATGSFNVIVRDTTPPQVVSISVSPDILWPPNHKMVLAQVTIVAVDSVDNAPFSRIVSVSSNQPVNGTGDGDTAPDWQITGPRTVNLRAERAGNDVRIYTIRVETSDFSGNTTVSTVQVQVRNGKGRI